MAQVEILQVTQRALRGQTLVSPEIHLTQTFLAAEQAVETDRAVLSDLWAVLLFGEQPAVALVAVNQALLLILTALLAAHRVMYPALLAERMREPLMELTVWQAQARVRALAVVAALHMRRKPVTAVQAERRAVAAVAAARAACTPRPDSRRRTPTTSR